MLVAFEQTMMRGQRRFDLGVLRQHRDVRRAETLRRLALGQTVIIDALLGHDACRFLRQCHAQLFRAWITSFAHLRSRNQDSTSSTGSNSESSLSLLRSASPGSAESISACGGK